MVGTAGDTSKTKTFQSRWRLAGALSLAAAALLAAGSLWSGILHDTVVHMVRLSARETPTDVSTTHGLVLCMLYWALFFATLFVALFLAVLDMRYIRLQYAIEKQQIFLQSLGDESAASARDKKQDS